MATFADGAGPSLADYLALDHDQMGPVVPAEFAAADVDALAADAALNQATFMLQAEGEDDQPPEDPPPEDPPPENPPENPQVDDPTVSNDNGTITVGGTLSDDDGLAGLSMSLDNVTGTIQINENGTFSILITDPGSDPVITITVTDANGNTTTINVQNPF